MINLRRRNNLKNNTIEQNVEVSNGDVIKHLLEMKEELITLTVKVEEHSKGSLNFRKKQNKLK